MKKILFVLFSAFTATLFIVTSFAHGGRTDSQGGHYDRDTGDYHYHHGYPAHDHYDMDGDGDKDCPYNYDDDTNHNQGGVAKIEKDKTEHKEGAVATTKNNTPEKTTSEKASNTNFDIVKYINALFEAAFISIIPSLLMLYFVLTISKKYTENISDKAKREKTEAVICVGVYAVTTIVVSIIMYCS